MNATAVRANADTVPECVQGRFEPQNTENGHWRTVTGVDKGQKCGKNTYKLCRSGYNQQSFVNTQPVVCECDSMSCHSQPLGIQSGRQFGIQSYGCDRNAAGRTVRGGDSKSKSDGRSRQNAESSIRNLTGNSGSRDSGKSGKSGKSSREKAVTVIHLPARLAVRSCMLLCLLSHMPLLRSAVRSQTMPGMGLPGSYFTMIRER